MVAEPDVGGNRPERIDLAGGQGHNPHLLQEAHLATHMVRAPRPAPDTHMVVVLPAPLWPRKDTTWFS